MIRISAVYRQLLQIWNLSTLVNSNTIPLSGKLSNTHKRRALTVLFRIVDL